jgi:hypothetical protein
MPPLDPFTLALGRLVGGAVACGFNLYATVVLVGLGSRLGWIPDLPDSLRGLEHPVVIGSAALLWAIETAIDRFVLAGAVWEGVHALVRPIASGMLVGLALSSQGWGIMIVGAAAGALCTLAAHGAKAGLRMRLGAAGRPLRRAGLGLAEDLLAIALVLAVLLRPAAACVVAIASLGVLIVAGPGLWRAGWLILRAVAARVRGFFGGADWRSPDQLPAGLRSLVEPDPLGVHRPRLTRAAVLGVPGVGAYRNGWLLIEHGAPFFLYQGALGPRRVALPASTVGRLRPGLVTIALELEGDHRPYAVYLLKDGPSARAALSEMVV